MNIIDLGIKRRGGLITESVLTQMGSAVEYALSHMLAGNPHFAKDSIQLRGTTGEINTFLSALMAEKAFQEALMKSNAMYTTADNLSKAVMDFERTTGLTWPFK